MVPTIEAVDEPAESLRAAIGAPLGRFNDERSGNDVISVPIAVTLSTPGSAEIIGGLCGDTGWDYLHVKFLFVPEAARGAGIGRELMRLAEVEACAADAIAFGWTCSVSRHAASTSGLATSCSERSRISRQVIGGSSSRKFSCQLLDPKRDGGRDSPLSHAPGDCHRGG